MEVTPNAKKASEREQDKAKKSKQNKKNNLLKYFGNGARVPAPTIARTPIDAVTQRRESRATGNNAPDKAGGKEGGNKKSELRKSSKTMPSTVSMPEDETKKGTKTRKWKTPQAGGKEGEHEVNLESMNKTPLKEKGKGGESKIKKKKEKPQKKKLKERSPKRRQSLLRQ
jgi:hypothetical protein